MPAKKNQQEVDDGVALLGRAKNNLAMGIVGLPNVGKSLTFSVLTKVQVPSENFPFCTINPTEARVAVPDKRFDWLCRYYKPKSEVAAYLEVTDIAGLIKGASDGLGLGNAFLANIKACDGIYHVVRVFPDDDITHVEGDVDPTRDMDIIADELVAKDLAILRGLVDETARKIERGLDKKLKDVLATLQKVQGLLEAKADLFHCKWTPDEVCVLNDLQLLACKPVVYLLNMSEKDYCKRRNKHLARIQEWIARRSPGSAIVPYSAKLEATLVDMASDQEREEYLRGLPARYGLAAEPGDKDAAVESALDKIIKAGYKALSLIHYFTAGEDEVRCWTIRRNTKAPAAAGVIHTDFQDFFICTDVFTFKDLKKMGSEAEVRAAGKVRTEGKDYVVDDGDIMYFKHNARGGAAKKK